MELFNPQRGTRQVSCAHLGLLNKALSYIKITRMSFRINTEFFSFYGFYGFHFIIEGDERLKY
jgi:hypothetical protein